tara:strand:+ start:426 stop:692 length:267 start_codon:yes stop_codon:yes gene_type:complete
MYKKKERFVLQSEYVNEDEEETKPKKIRKLRQNEIFDMKKKVKKISELDKKFKEHAKHHTKEHIATMKKEMQKGKTFKESHKIALQKD